MPYCADCSGKPCRKREDVGTAPKGCPTRETDPAPLSRYDETDLAICRSAAAVEGHGYGRLTRVEEIMDFALRQGYRKLGIAFCVGFSHEAAVLADILRKNGFAVESVCCKNGSVTKEEAGIPKEDQIDPCAAFEIMCNPAGQAAFLDAAGVDLALVLGLCVGHDTVFLRHVRAPVTYVAVKDRATGHNPLAAIYCADGYFRRVYSFVKTHWSKNKTEEEQS